MSAKGSELKRVRQSIKRRDRNKHYKSLLSSTVKKVLSINKKEDALEAFSQASKTIDKIAAKGIIHKNKASNKKSKLRSYINSL
ncbi:MAG: 30S ribosomal protein S20 [Candidatus Marinimicrobia bacterium]|nr:30S ribosomal protein S20 [Candidatus Neomarinimicrobiota bacterium]|tara:strand:- start:2356 stop:2607 length:252 start_codon:yes stop_codon:yes gene_type:complete